jgi:hypothetical protein
MSGFLKPTEKPINLDIDTAYLLKASDELSNLGDFSGDNGTFDGGGSIQGTLSLSTTASELISNSKVWKYVTSATSNGSYFGWTRPVTGAMKGKDCGFFLKGRMVTFQDNEVQAVVKIVGGTSDGKVITFPLKSNSVAYTYSNGFFCPLDATSVKFGYQILTDTVGKEFYFDGMEISSNPFKYVTTIQQQTYYISQAQNSMTDVAAEVRFNLATANIKQSGSGLFTITDDSANSRTLMRVLTGCDAIFNTSAVVTSASQSIDIFVNGVAARGNLSAAHAATEYGGSSVNVHLNAGDLVSIQGYSVINGSYGGAMYWNISATATQDNVLVNGEGMKRIAVYAKGNNGQALTANVTNINWTEVEDTTNSWDGFTFTTPEDGDYSISGSLGVTSGIITTGPEAYINGVSNRYMTITEGASVSYFPFAGTLRLLKGQLLTFRLGRAATQDAGNPSTNWLSITKLATISAPILAVPAATQTEYHLECYGNGGQSITANATDIPFIATLQKNLVWDGSGFTAPFDGNYEISSQVCFNASASGRSFDLYTNGTLVKSLAVQPYTATILSGSTKIFLTAGQRISLRTDVSGTCNNNPKYHWITIIRLNGKNDGVLVSNYIKEQIAFLRVSAIGEYADVSSSTSYKAIPYTSVEGDYNIAQISGTQITLAQGDYEIGIPLGCNGVAGWIDARIYNVTDSADIKVFNRVIYNSITSVVAMNTAMTKFTLGGTKVIRIDTKSGAAGGAEGFSTIKIRKLY